MKFLCLHGMGTSSQILQIQTAALRRELGNTHTYEYLQGTIECPMAPEIAHLSNPNTAHYQYFNPDALSYLSALDQLEDHLQHHGPYDGVLGFSQGAGMALMFLIRHSHLYPDRPLPFKVAILFSRVGVYDPARWVETGEAVTLEETPAEIGKIKIPVAVFWGKQDWEMATREAATTKGLVQKEYVWEYAHDGGHEIPGAAYRENLREIVKTIHGAVGQARS